MFPQVSADPKLSFCIGRVALERTDGQALPVQG